MRNSWVDRTVLSNQGQVDGRSMFSNRGLVVGRSMIHLATAALVALAFCGLTRSASAQLEFERPPINYTEAESQDPIARLQAQLDAGEVELEYHPTRGYLDDLLVKLQVPEESQALVFSKTSFQLRRIDPRRPRAVYFGDDVYLGFVQNGDVVEAMAVDPVLGPIFYTLEQQESEPPKFVRDRGQCLTCHASSRTQGVPGAFVRSVFVDRGGQPLLGSGTFTTDHRSPFEQRWGGWYVTGTHGDSLHMGNGCVENPKDSNTLDRVGGANVVDLSSRIRLEPYRTPHSDIVGLMVLEHQSYVQNLITLAHYETRLACHYDGVMNEALQRPAEHRSDSTERRITSVVEKLVDGMLLVDEFPLTEPVTGTSGFAETFSQSGKQDSQGRGLRQLDLQTRLFRYPCSYLIETTHFDTLPDEVKQRVAERIEKVLSDPTADPRYRHISAEDAQAVLEILSEIKPELFGPAASAAREASAEETSEGSNG
ncbi:MAG: hypothetical protein R3B96_15535 [Pirellulaceae bacterium]